MTRVVLTDSAKQDRLDIWLYVAVDNLNAADRLLDEIDETPRLLAGAPGLGRAHDGTLYELYIQRIYKRMTWPGKIPDTNEAWDAGQLGRAAEHARPAAADNEKAIDASLGLQLISIRLQKSLIEDFKAIASLNGIGYQPLMRQILKRFVDGEKRRIAREKVADRQAVVTSGKRK